MQHELQTDTGGTTPPLAEAGQERPTGGVDRAQAWIPEVQGLRTLALLLVATFHIWFGRVSGGVDIFLVVSAYLMTRSLFGRLDRGAPLRPFRYILTRFARLMPLAAAVAAATMLFSVFFQPMSRLRDLLEQFLASVTYSENRWLQDASVDYLADAAGLASPFQQFWSLSIQGQVFAIWPLVFLVVHGLHVLTGARIRTLALWIFGSLLVVGFAWSVFLTLDDQPYAYFDLGARVWEFAAGSVLALVAPWLRFGRRVRGVLSWLGIAGALTCGFVMPVEGTFPGVAALWPVIATALVIVGAGSATSFGGDRLLAHPAMTRIGDYTYALYLIHWPLLIFTLTYFELDRLNLLAGTLVLLASGVLSVLAVHLVDRPFAWFTTRGRGGRFPWRPAIVVVTLPALAFGVTVAADPWMSAQRDHARYQLATAPLDEIGPNAPAAERLEPKDDVVPSPWIVKQDLGFLFGCPQDMLPIGAEPDALDECQSNVDVVDRTTAERSVYVVGNSHAQQMTQMVSEVARHSDWAVRAYLRFGCQYDGFGDGGRAESVAACKKMWTDATFDILQNSPDAVVVMANRNDVDDVQQDVPGLAEWISTITAAGIPVIAVRDNPRGATSLVDCGERFGFGSERCSWPTTLTEPNPRLQATMEAAGAVYLDPNELICPEGRCRAQVGGVVTYYDTNHVTATYMRALAYTLSPIIRDRVPWWTDLNGVKAI